MATIDMCGPQPLHPHTLTSRKSSGSLMIILSTREQSTLLASSSTGGRATPSSPDRAPCSSNATTLSWMHLTRWSYRDRLTSLPPSTQTPYQGLQLDSVGSHNSDARFQLQWRCDLLLRFIIKHELHHRSKWLHRNSSQPTIYPHPRCITPTTYPTHHVPRPLHTPPTITYPHPPYAPPTAISYEQYHKRMRIDFQCVCLVT